MTAFPPHPSVTRALLRKDWRLLRPLTAAAAMLMLGCYVVIPAILLASWWPRWRSVQDVSSTVKFAWLIGAGVDRGALLMWLALPILFAAIGGVSFALERREHWAEFAAMLPVSRRRHVVTKFLVTVGVCSGIAAINALIAMAAFVAESAHLRDSWPSTLLQGASSGPSASPILVVAAIAAAAGIVWLTRLQARRSLYWVAAVCLLGTLTCSGGLAGMLGNVFAGARVFDKSMADLGERGGFMLVALYVAVAVAIFGVGWLTSTLSRSPVLAATVAIALVCGTFGWHWSTITILEQTNDEHARVFALQHYDAIAARYYTIAFTTAAGMAAVLGGGVVQTRRVSP